MINDKIHKMTIKINEQKLTKEIRTMITSGRIPVHVVHNNKDYFRNVPRMSYFSSLATSILLNNQCLFTFSLNAPNTRETQTSNTNNINICDDRFSIGVAYDLSDPSHLPWKLYLTTSKKDDNGNGNSLKENKKIYEETENVKETENERRDMFKEHTNNLRQAEFIETGNIARLNNMSVEEYKRMKKSIMHDNYDISNIFTIPNKQVAVRYHFNDKETIVISHDMHKPLFGVCQGRVLWDVPAVNAIYLKDVDNFLHLCFPNAKAEINSELKEPVIVTLRPVPGTLLIKDNIVKLSGESRLEVCENYVKKKLNLRGNLFMYYDGLFLIDKNEPLYNLCVGGKCAKTRKLTIFYSISEAWL